MKFFLLLIANCLVILYSVLFFMDHALFPTETSAKIRHLLLLGFTCYIGYDIVSIYILKNRPIENGLLYKLFTVLQKSWYSTQTFIQPVQKEFFISVLIAAVCLFIGLALSGLPGGFMITALQKIGWCQGIKGDASWPAALLLSLCWPLCFPLSVLVKQYLVTQGYMGFTGLATVLALGWIVLLLLFTMLFGGAKS